MSLSKENNFKEEKQHFDKTLYWSIRHTQERTHAHTVTVETARFSQAESIWVSSSHQQSYPLLPQTPVQLLTVQNALLCVRVFNECHHLGWALLLLTSFNQYYMYIIYLYCYILDETFWEMYWCRGCILIDILQVFWLLFDFTSLLVVIWQWTMGRGRAASKGSKKIAGNREVVMLTKVIIAEERCNDWIPDRVCV